MPLLVALFLRSFIQFAVTWGIVELAARLLLPLLNRAIAAIMVLYGVSEETAQDGMANEIILSAEAIGVGALALRSKMPSVIAEKLGFTTKGFRVRALTSPVATAIKTAKARPVDLAAFRSGSVQEIIATSAGAAGFLSQRVKDVLTLIGVFIGLPTAIFYALAQYIDFANWPQSAYRSFFQGIFAAVGLKPDEPYRRAQFLETKVFNQIFTAFEKVGAVAIADPFKLASVPFTKQNLIDLTDQAASKLFIEGGEAKTKQVMAMIQGLVKLRAEASDALVASALSALGVPAAAAAPTPPAVPQVKVFTGIVQQGVLGEQVSFAAREDDLIETVDELRAAAQNNLASFLSTLAGRIIYELKIIPTVVTRDGTRRFGQSQQVLRGYRKDGKAIYRNVTNKFAVIDIFIFTERNVRTKIAQIILGPTNAATLQPKAADLSTITDDLAANLVTANIAEIEAIQTSQPLLVTAPPVVPLAVIPAPQEIVPSSGAYTFTYAGNLYVDNKLIGPSAPELLSQIAQIPGIRFLGTLGGTLDEVKAFLLTKGITVLELAPVAQAGAPGTIPVPPEAKALKCAAATVFEWFNSTGEPFPSVAERAPLYDGLGLGPASLYTGTAEQNIKLLAALKRVNGC